MNAETQKILDDRYSTLPKEIQDIYRAFPWKDTLHTILLRNGMKEDVFAAFETETQMLLYGITVWKDYGNNLVNEAGLDSKTSENLVKEVLSEIIMPIDKRLAETTKGSTPTPSTSGPASNLPEIRPSTEISPILGTKPTPASPSPEAKPEMVVIKPKPENIPKFTIPTNISDKPSDYIPGKDPYRETFE